MKAFKFEFLKLFLTQVLGDTRVSPTVSPTLGAPSKFTGENFRETESGPRQFSVLRDVF